MKKFYLILWILIACVLEGKINAQALFSPTNTLQDSNLTFLHNWTNFDLYGPKVVGDYLVYGSGFSLQVLKVNNPDSITFVREVPTPYRVRNVFVSGQYAYLAMRNSSFYDANDSSGIFIVDVSNPAKAHKVGFLPLGQFWNLEIAVKGDYAYLAYKDTVIVVDVKNPASPQKVTAFKTNGGTGRLAVSGNYLYVALDNYDLKFSGCQVFDISNPLAPTEVWLLQDTRRTVPLIFAYGNYLYFTNDSYQFSIYDLSNISSPVLLTTVSTDSKISGLYVSDNIAYIVNNSGLTLYDVSDPAAPQKKGLFSQANLVDVYVDQGNQRAYLKYYYNFGSANDLKLFIVDVSDVNAPQELTSFSTGRSSVNRFAFVDHYAYVSFNNEDLFIFDISNPETPELIKKIKTGSLGGLSISGNYLYFTSSDNGLFIYDITDPANPIYLNMIKGLEKLVHVEGNYLYHLSSDDFSVYDVSNPQSPVRLSFFYTSLRPSRMKVSGNYVYVASTKSKLYILDISDPSKPVQVGEFSLGASAIDVDVYGQYAYVGLSYYGFKIIDVSNPAAPSEVAAISTNQTSYLHIAGNYLYTQEGDYVSVYDLSDPVNLKKIGFAEIRYYNIYEVGVYGWNIFVGHNEGFMVYQNDLTVGILEKPNIAQHFTLFPNFPNPFNPRTTIRFNIAKNTQVELTIFDINGRQVRTLLNSYLTKGNYQVVWDGLNAMGLPVSSGIYFYRLKTNQGQTQIRKMTLVR